MNLTRSDIRNLESNEKAARPNRFTGKWRGQYFFKGYLWNGPPNHIGNRSEGHPVTTL
jgi:hypothetical protein